MTTTDPPVAPVGWRFPLMRWEDLKHHYLRALAQDVTIRDDPDYPGLFGLATSGTKKGVEYRVNEFMCACEAGVHGDDCKHRALYLVLNAQRLGRVFYTTDGEVTWSESSPTSAVVESE